MGGGAYADLVRILDAVSAGSRLVAAQRCTNGSVAGFACLMTARNDYRSFNARDC